MVKVGRNDSCPCGSGLKYKKCCLLREERPSPSAKAEESTSPAFVHGEIDRLRNFSAARQASFRLIGALVFFSTVAGDAWMLELTEQDAVPVARGGEPLAVTVNETDDVFEIGWTHRFDLKGQVLVATAYLDSVVSAHQGCPVREIREAMDHLRRQYSQRELASLRVEKP
jgi:hypothetical protein